MHFEFLYLKFIAKHLFKYWVERLTRISVKKMNGIFTPGTIWLCSITLWYYTNTHIHTTRSSEEETVQPPTEFFCINSEYLEIHRFGSTKCLRANVHRYFGAGHFRKRWKGSADVDANLPLRDILNQTDNRTTCQNKALIISVLVLCSSTCGPQLSYDAAYYPGILLVRLAIAFQLLYFHTKKKKKKKNCSALKWWY